MSPYRINAHLESRPSGGETAIEKVIILTACLLFLFALGVVNRAYQKEAYGMLAGRPSTRSGTFALSDASHPAPRHHGTSHHGSHGR